MIASVFIISFACIGGLLVLYGYGLEEKAYKLSKYQIAFLLGLFVAEVML